MEINDLRKIIEQQLKENKNLGLDDLQKKLNQIRDMENRKPIPEFEGYSAEDMHQIMYFTFKANCPIQIKLLKEEEYLKIPILNQIRYLAEIINREGGLKLTVTGNLPVKVVKELYEQGFYKEKYIEIGWVKLNTEDSSNFIKLSKYLIQLSGIAKKEKNKLILTKKSKNILNDNSSLFQAIFSAYTEKMNWAFFDYYGDHNIGQLAYGFSLILLSKYGNIKRLDQFYAEKYITAFPALLNYISSKEYRSVKEGAYDCYSFRTFNQFLKYFGLITIEEEGIIPDKKTFITKTELFDLLFEIKKP